MARWIEGQQSRGNNVAAEEGKGLLGKYGDIYLASVTNPIISETAESQSVKVGTEKVYPEISLEAEIERQAKIYLELEFHKHKNIRISKGEFKDLVMGLITPQSEGFRGRLNTPVVVFGQIPAQDQCKLAGIDYFLDGLNVRDWPDDPQQYRTPKTAYIMWADEGARFMNRKVQDVRQELAVDERGGTEFDGIALYVAKPKVLQTRFLDLPGTAVGSGSAAPLILWADRPRLNDRFVGLADPRFGSVVCGRKK